MMPATNFSVVIKEKAALIYAIQTDKSINVDLVIQNLILHGVNIVAVRLYHPSLITELCKNVGLVWTQDEEVLQPKRVIDNNLVYAIKDWGDVSVVGASSSRPRAIPTRPITQMEWVERLETSFD